MMMFLSFYFSNSPNNRGVIPPRPPAYPYWRTLLEAGGAPAAAYTLSLFVHSFDQGCYLTD